MTPSAAAPDVSRETHERLDAYAASVEKWTPRINLVSKSDAAHLWTRHIADSMQLFHLQSRAKLWCDIGSGGGFPGLVLAIMAAEGDPARETVLIESDQRKCAFLRTVARELSLKVRVIADRIENVAPVGADVVSARALSDLDQLLGYAKRHLGPQGTALFPKGRRWQQEVEAARAHWTFDLVTHPSRTDPDAAILEVRTLERV
ncbi:16S rRNA (guanine(527)-N(7))-methyltransferase RsmG [Sulfitobacter sp. D35]|uniref:16S rRNA (guanine(527)-N(7))-methyltransferase RsmG n=1 Tax=Sulfitobacter sp. D35 TaxID=3083252 RepID=UPI00296F90A1|nr:16S rRNA (guanine(527)-N(7))-methyltransferase RsmG [Sulfitobacter sp. D35]MDW4498071.1 16S rRNA (guanine(527)-N(7))-methyltransferase RsmG [Sulfitobacter sp. D35]